ncbi:MAG: hypothetical protein ACTSQB_04710 [Candidatus Heimdallarchaeota archaeon]
MFNDEEKKTLQRLPTRQSIHNEIEETLIKRLFTIVEEIEELPDGKLNFKPYTDHILVQLETFLEKKFKQKIFDRTEDKQITDFLEQVTIERERRDFGLLLNR